MASKYCDRVKSCKQSWWCADDYNPERDNHECFIQLTNADRIRAMSDEELAEFIETCACPPHKDCAYRETGCILCWLDWLRQEVET